MALEVEDEVFFADLSKQISMLIMDDEEEFPTQCPPLPVQEIAYRPQMMMSMPPYISEVVQRRERKGTGVFIPKSTAPRKKNKSRRPTPSSMENSNSNNNSQSQSQSQSQRQQQIPPIYPNYNCSNSSSFLKRHI